LNKAILKTGVQDFTKNNYNTDILSVLLSRPVFADISQQELAQQLEGVKKAESKLPTWFSAKGIYYPTGVQMEQTSSEITAAYKAGLVTGKWLADLTGGFGVDTFFFSQRIPNVVSCEQEGELHEIAKHNAQVLGHSQVDFRHQDGIDFLQTSGRVFDWIYLDPGRRDDGAKKVFLLSDCQPDILQHLDLLLEKSEHLLIKTSPMLDLSAGIGQLKKVEEIHVVAVRNEVKELLWILGKETGKEDIRIKTINLTPAGDETFEFLRTEEPDAECRFSLPAKFLYEPNSAILKAGAFKLLCPAFGVDKIQEHSHLYTSEVLMDFPGRTFRIKKVYPYNRKTLRPFKGKKANVTTRNFPETVAQIRKKLDLKDGGDIYLFFTTNNLGERIVIQCIKEYYQGTPI
jgi:hypothetical protein